MGVTLKGEKVVLGFVQTATVNELVCSQFLRGLVERGVDGSRGVLCVIDGSKGLRKAVDKEVRQQGDRPALSLAQAGKRGSILVDGASGGVLTEVAARLPAAQLREGQSGLEEGTGGTGNTQSVSGGQPR